MEEATRKMLDQIDEFLVGDNQNAAVELWDVMTALRGPDSHDSSTISEYKGMNGLKSATTAPIRRAALPRTAEAPYPYSTISTTRASFGYRNDAFEGFVRRDGLHRIDRSYMQHFDLHVALAAEVLGLIKAKKEEKDGDKQAGDSKVSDTHF